MEAKKLFLFSLTILLSLVSCDSLDTFVPNEIVGEIDGLIVQNGVVATFDDNPRYLGDGTTISHDNIGDSKLVTFSFSYRILREQSIFEDIHFKLFPGLYPFTGALFPLNVEYYGISVTDQHTLMEVPLLAINEFASRDYSFSFSRDNRFIFPRYFNVFIPFDDLINNYSRCYGETFEMIIQLSLFARRTDGNIDVAAGSHLRFAFDDELVTFIGDLHPR